MNIQLFQKMQILVLALLTCASITAADYDNDFVKELKGTGEIILQKLSNAKEAMQNKGVEAADWVNSNWNGMKSGLREMIKEAADKEVLVKARKSLQDGCHYIKNMYKSTAEKTGEVVKNTGDALSENLNAAKSASQDYLNSCKQWFNNTSNLSSEELVLIGGGAVIAVVAIGGVTYVLYKNGTIKKIGETITTYPVLTVASTATVGLLLTAIYKMYTDSNNSSVVTQ